MDCMATRLMSSGAAKSGKPWERLTAPYFMASRVISRITDSVNRLALRETRREIEGAGVVIRVSAADLGGPTRIRSGIISLRPIRVHVRQALACRSLCDKLKFVGHYSGRSNFSCSTIDRTAVACDPFGASR